MVVTRSEIEQQFWETLLSASESMRVAVASARAEDWAKVLVCLEDTMETTDQTRALTKMILGDDSWFEWAD